MQPIPWQSRQARLEHTTDGQRGSTQDEVLVARLFSGGGDGGGREQIWDRGLLLLTSIMNDFLR